MAYEKGITAQIEDWMVTVLTALTADSKAVFKTCAPWQHQLTAGAQSFGGKSPFAFVGHSPNAAPQREGGYDLCQVLRFEVIYGQDSSTDGIARRGDSNHLGTSRMRDLIIAALDETHPGDGFACDDFYLAGEYEFVDAARYHQASLVFEAKFMND